jgi:hypothetical protein
MAAYGPGAFFLGNDLSFCRDCIFEGTARGMVDDLTVLRSA